MRQFFLLLIILFTVTAFASSFDYEMLNPGSLIHPQSFSSINRLDWTLLMTLFYPINYTNIQYANEFQYLQFINYDWDGSGWVQTISYEVTYSGGLADVFYLDTGTGMIMEEITYDNVDRVEQIVSSMDMGSGYTEFMRETFGYNANGVLNSYVVDYWSPTRDWMNGLQWIITLDGDHIVTVVQQEWDFVGQEWINDTRMNYTWENDRVTEHLQEEWVDNAWINTDRHEFIYDGNFVVEAYDYVWNGSWINDTHTTITWDQDLLVHQLEEEWDGSAWVQSEDHTTTYNANNKPIEWITLEWTGTEWVNEHMGEYFYDTNANNILPTEEFQLTIYPNPFNPETTISWDLGDANYDELSLQIFNVKGKLVRSTSLDSQTGSFNWDGKDDLGISVSSGIYFIKLHSDGLPQLIKKCSLIK